MCVEVYAVPTELGRVSIDRLSKVSGLSVKKRRWPVDNSIHFALEPGCSCSLLTDNADWNKPTWDIVQKARDGLCEALKLLHSEARGFTFQAIWIGDKPESEELVPLKI